MIETPLIFATQTAATIADLDIEGMNLDEPNVTEVNTNVTTNSTVGMTMSSPERRQVVSGVPIVPSTSSLQVTHSVEPDTGGILSTVPSVVTGASSVTSIVPYDKFSMSMPPYNSSAMYEGSALPVYVDYIGNIMPILDRQSIATNWPLTPHPLTGQVRYMPYNSANMPTIPYIMGVGSASIV